MKRLALLPLALCAMSCVAQNTVTVNIGGTTYTGTLAAQASAPVVTTPPVTAPAATPQLPKVFMGGAAWPLNQPATQYPVETRSLRSGAGDDFYNPKPIADVFRSTFGAAHINFDTSMRITTVDTRQTPGLFLPVSITTGWGSDDEIDATDPLTGVVTRTVPRVPALNCKIEGGSTASPSSDRHCLIYDVATAYLHEFFNVHVTGTATDAAAYRRWDTARPQVGAIGQNSADAAGLPILPLLLRYAEAAAGPINHALRFTINLSRLNNNGGAFVLPASHASGSNWGSTAYMGMRLVLRKDYALPAGYANNVIAQRIVTCLKIYGIVLADNGNSGTITADNDSHWDGTMLTNVGGSMTLADFIPVNSGAIIDATGAQVQ